MASRQEDPGVVEGLAHREFESLWRDRKMGLGRHSFPVGVTLFLNGERVKDVREINQGVSQNLHVTRIPDKKDWALAAFTERSDMVRLATQEIDYRDFTPGHCYDPRDLPVYVDFYEHINFRGRQFRVATREGSSLNAVPDLRPWGGNDLFSSMGACLYAYSIFADVNFQGEEYMDNTRCDHPDLRNIGFNDRISSIINWGVSGPPTE